jgi:hypothetical protein
MEGNQVIERARYFEAQALFKQIKHELDTQPLTEAQRTELQNHASALAGVLASPWFPVPWSRRLIMAAIFLFGVQQALIGNYEPMLWWLLLPLFSPRLVGEAANLFGAAARLLHRGG